MNHSASTNQIRPQIIPIFIPHGGCPERCTFCDQTVSGGEAVPYKEIELTIKTHLSTLKQGQKAQVAFYGGTFTALRHSLQLSYLNAIQPYLQQGIIEGIRIATRPDAIELHWIQRLLNEFKLLTIEFGVQSFDPVVLQALGRTHTLDQLQKATESIRLISSDLSIGYHLMYGCPKEAPWPEALELIKKYLTILKPNFIRLHPLVVLEDTALGRSGFTPLTLEQAVERGADLLALAQELKIKVHRIGLQANEIMDKGQKMEQIKGPYHPAMGELVRSRLYRQLIESELKDLQKTEPKRNHQRHTITIDVVESERSALVGQGRCNTKWWQEHYPLFRIGVNVIKGQRSKDHLYANYKIRCHHITRTP